MDVTLIVITIWIFSTCLHEFGHAITAYIAGDKSVKEKGYLTLNPMVYFNSVTTLIIPLFVLLIGGIPLPGAAVYINHTKIKSRLWLSLVSFAGPLFTFLFLLLLAGCLNLLAANQAAFTDPKLFVTIYSSLAFLLFLHIFVLILNLLPLPPLDGFGIIEPWLPKKAQRKARELSNYGFALLFILFFMVKPFARFMTDISLFGTAMLGADLKGVILAMQTFDESSKYLVFVLIAAWLVKSKFESPATKGDKALNQQNYEEALKYYLEAREKNKDDTRLDLAIATCYLSLGKGEDAHIYLDHALKSDPTDIKAIGLKAACLSEAGQYQEASQLLATIDDSQDNDIAFPFIVKGSALLETGKQEEALSAFNKALEIEPRNVSALQIKASCLTQMGRFDEALDVYSTMARIKEGLQVACLMKGMLLIALDKQDEGFSEIKKILSPKEEDRPEDIRRLKKLFMEKAVEFNGANHLDEAKRLQAAAKLLAEGSPLG